MKTSIEKKYAVVFSLLIAIVIVVCWCANALLLSHYYISRKAANIKVVYEQLDMMSSEYGIESEQFKTIFESNAGTFNCDILILDQDMSVIAANVMDESTVSEKLLGYFFAEKKDVMPRIIAKTNAYTLQMTTNFSLGQDYIELWGVMSSGNPIVISSPVAGIHDNAKLANVLLAYIGIVVIIISYFIVKILSRKIIKPVLQMVEISDKMAKLDFDTKYEGDDKNEIGLLGQHMNKMSETLEKTISELKTANAELESELKKRTEVDDMRKEFISNVSHELKTPIALIQGYAEGLVDCVNDDEDSKNFYCEVIIDETSRMNRLVRSLLELNELEFGNNKLSIERFDIVELVKNCITASDMLIKQNDIEVSINAEGPTFVWSDEFRIEQVFNNYFSNAIHYASGEKKIIKVDIIKNDDKVRVNVYNSGNQIPEEVLSHIWDKFYKADKARTREYGGSGVGLSIVKAAMDALNQKYGVVNCTDGVEFFFEADSR